MVSGVLVTSPSPPGPHREAWRHVRYVASRCCWLPVFLLGRGLAVVAHASPEFQPDAKEAARCPASCSDIWQSVEQARSPVLASAELPRGQR